MFTVMLLLHVYMWCFTLFFIYLKAGGKNATLKVQMPFFMYSFQLVSVLEGGIFSIQKIDPTKVLNETSTVVIFAKLVSSSRLTLELPAQVIISTKVKVLIIIIFIIILRVFISRSTLFAKLPEASVCT